MNETIPIEYAFTFPVRVRFADTDLQGHVFFGNYFTYCDEGFMAYLDEIEYSWEKLGNMGLELYYVESSCQFKGRAFFADILEVNIRVIELRRSAMTVEMMISKNNKDEIVAIGRITAVMVSTKTGKSTPIPSELRAALKQA